MADEEPNEAADDDAADEETTESLADLYSLTAEIAAALQSETAMGCTGSIRLR